MTYTIISLVTLTWFLLWAYKHEGVPESISSLFYRAKTQWTYTMVISGIGVLMTLVEPKTMIHYTGISLILGTAAPDYRNTNTLKILSLWPYIYYRLFSLVECGRDLPRLCWCCDDLGRILFS